MFFDNRIVSRRGLLIGPGTVIFTHKNASSNLVPATTISSNGRNLPSHGSNPGSIPGVVTLG